MKQIGWASLAGCGALICAPAALAENTDQDTIVIEALRSELTESETGSAIILLDRRQLDRRGLFQGADALALAAGVTVSEAGAFGGVAYARIRGGNPGQTLVVIDGAPANDMASPGGGFDLSLLDISDIERIEVLKGPQSALWGSDAVGGVISVLTRGPLDGDGSSGFAEAGSYGHARIGGRIFRRAGSAGGTLAGSFARADGPSKADERYGAAERDGYRSLSLSGTASLDLSEAVEADLSVRGSQLRAEADGYPPPDYVFSDTAGWSEAASLSAIASATARSADRRLSGRVEVSYAETERTDDDGDGGVFAANGRREGYRLLGRFAPDEASEATVGLEHETVSAFGSDARTRSVFVTYATRLGEGVRMSAGARLDDDDRFGSVVTRNASISWRLNRAVRLRSSWGEGFKAPTLFQAGSVCVFCGLDRPNPDLRAERSEGYDMGADIDIGAVSLSIGAFAQKTRDLIDFSYAKGYDNIALARQSGIEADADIAIGAHSGLRLAYMYVDARSGSGDALPRVPAHSGDVEFRHERGRLGLSLAVRYNGEQEDGFAGRTPAWMRIDLAGSWRLGPRALLYARLENGLNEHYQPLIGFAAPGRSLYAGIRILG
jgi:vitamin B12 transporter